jgi:L-alanine-DL-glutamate epimerase-like enolase superfamily enzyme
MGATRAKSKTFGRAYYAAAFTAAAVLTSALSVTEQALWDIKGKLYGVPVYEL